MNRILLFASFVLALLSALLFLLDAGHAHASLAGAVTLYVGSHLA